MLEGVDFPSDHVVGIVEPGGVRATVKDIAINAAMAGCLPQYMPVLTAAIEAITDPAFNLREVQCTSCNMAPLLIVSGPRIDRRSEHQLQLRHSKPGMESKFHDCPRGKT